MMKFHWFGWAKFNGLWHLPRPSDLILARGLARMGWFKH